MGKIEYGHKEAVLLKRLSKRYLSTYEKGLLRGEEKPMPKQSTSRATQSPVKSRRSGGPGASKKRLVLASAE